MLVHGEEALLAVGFIFTIHFFNGHFRPEQVPDRHRHLHRLGPGSTSWEEERPGEYERLKRQGRIEVARRTASRRPRWRATARIVGGLALTIGVLLFLLIVRAVLF